MPRVFVSIGSNIDRDEHVRAAVKSLNALYQPLTLSTVYESAPIGFHGDNFYNLVVGFNTNQSVKEVGQQLANIEDTYGRARSGRANEPRTLDLDLLLYGDLCLHDGNIDIPRAEIQEHAFVLRPLAEVAAEHKHPETGLTLGEMWRNFDDVDQTLWPVAFDFGLDR